MNIPGFNEYMEKNVKISYFDLHFQKDQFLKCFVSIPKCKVVFFYFHLLMRFIEKALFLQENLSK